MTRGFTAEVAAVLEQGLVDMAVAELGTNETDIRLAQRPLEAEVAHQRADHRPVQGTAGLPVAGQHEQQVVADADHTVAVDEHHPDAVAVEGRSAEYTYELQSLILTPYADSCLEKQY